MQQRKFKIIFFYLTIFIIVGSVNNIQLNNLNYVTSFNQAVSNSDDSIDLFLNSDESGHSMFSKSSESIKIDSTSLQNFFDENKIDHCDFIKLDCEGAEYEIIRNLPVEYFQRINKFVIEYHMADTHPELLIELKLGCLNLRLFITANSLATP